MPQDFALSKTLFQLEKRRNFKKEINQIWPTLHIIKDDVHIPFTNKFEQDQLNR